MAGTSLNPAQDVSWTENNDVMFVSSAAASFGFGFGLETMTHSVA